MYVKNIINLQVLPAWRGTEAYRLPEHWGWQKYTVRKEQLHLIQIIEWLNKCTGLLLSLINEQRNSIEFFFFQKSKFLNIVQMRIFS